MTVMETCSCGAEWTLTNGVRSCGNCDRVQAQESGHEPKPRRVTKSDVRMLTNLDELSRAAFDPLERPVEKAVKKFRAGLWGRI